MEREKAQIHDFKDLIVWQKSFELTRLVYKATYLLPKSEQFGLISQIQRAAVSIPSNIAEGCNRNHKNEYIQFLGIAIGSAAELETQLLLCKSIYPNSVDPAVLSLLNEVQRMLRTLVRNLRSQS